MATYMYIHVCSYLHVHIHVHVSHPMTVYIILYSHIPFMYATRIYSVNIMLHHPLSVGKHCNYLLLTQYKLQLHVHVQCCNYDKKTVSVT